MTLKQQFPLRRHEPNVMLQFQKRRSTPLSFINVDMDTVKRFNTNTYYIIARFILLILALLDFSSAFDTIDHNILVHSLHTDFGFTETVLQWFSSYLTGRTHYVSLSNHCSAFAPVHSGVSQGSVLGPMIFTMYIKPLSAIIDSNFIIHHSFADNLLLLKIQAKLVYICCLCEEKGTYN